MVFHNFVKLLVYRLLVDIICRLSNRKNDLNFISLLILKQPRNKTLFYLILSYNDNVSVIKYMSDNNVLQNPHVFCGKLSARMSIV